MERRIWNGCFAQIDFKQVLVIQKRDQVNINGRISWELLIGDTLRQIQVTPFLLNLKTEEETVFQ